MKWYPIKPIRGIEFDEKYVINRKGQIKNKYTGYMYSIGSYKDGRPSVSLFSKDGKMYTLLLYRLYVNNFKRSVDGMVVHHGTFDPSSMDLKHLHVCTQKENIHESIKAGRMRIQGETNGNCRGDFTNNNVHEICKYLEHVNNYTYAEILKNVGIEVNQQTLDIMTKIRTGKLWTSITSQYNIPPYTTRKMFTYKSYEKDIYDILDSNPDASVNDVYTTLGITFDNNKKYQAFWRYFNRLKDKHKLRRSTTIENDDEYYTINIPGIEFVNSKLLDECDDNDDCYNIIIK